MFSAPVRQSLNAVHTPVIPVVANDQATTKRNTAVVITVLGNDVDADAATVQITTNGAHGTAVANGNGTVTYTPATDYVGADSFNYRVKSPSPDALWSAIATVGVTVTAPAAPVVVGHSIYVQYNASWDVYPLDGATDADNDIVKTTTSLVITQPAHGMAVKSGSGDALKITYVPTTNYSGADSFTFTINDAEGNTSNVGTVTVQVAGAPSTDGTPAWVLDTSHWSQFTLRIGARAKGTSGKNWETTRCRSGTDVEYYVLPPQGAEVLPIGINGGLAAGEATYPKGVAQQIAAGRTWQSIHDIIRDCIHESQYDLGGVTVILPKGYFEDYDFWGQPAEIWGYRHKVRFVGAFDGTPSWFTTGGNGTWIYLYHQTGFNHAPTAGSRVRWESIVFHGSVSDDVVPSSSRAFMLYCDQANIWQFVNCTFRNFGEAFHANSWQESVVKGTTGLKRTDAGYPLGVYDISMTGFEFRRVGLWFDRCVFMLNGQMGQAWHQWYALGAQLVFDRSAMFNTICAHHSDWGENGRHELKCYGSMVANDCLIANRFGNDVTYEDMQALPRTSWECAWGCNMDIGIHAPWFIARNTRFLFRERQMADGTIKPIGQSGQYNFSQAGARPRMNGVGVTVPFPMALPNHLEQYKAGQNFGYGVWQDTLSPDRVPTKPQPNDDTFYGFAFGVFRGSVATGAARLTPAETPDQYGSTAKFTTGVGISVTPPTGALACMISFPVEYLAAPGTFGFRSELATFDGSGFVLQPGGGPRQGEKIPQWGWFAVWPAARADNPRRRMLNPVMYDKNDPNYFWPKVAAAVYNPLTPTNKDWLRYRNVRLFVGNTIQYIGKGAAPYFFETATAWPYLGNVSDNGAILLPAPPQWDGVGSKPAGSGTFSGLPVQKTSPAGFGGTTPTGTVAGGHAGTDYIEPAFVGFFNNAYVTRSSGIGNSTTPTKPDARLYRSDFKMLDEVGGNAGVQSASFPAIPTARFDSAGNIVTYSDAAAFPTEAQTTLAADVAWGATTITVASSAGMSNGMAIRIMMAHDPWALTPWHQVLSDRKGIAEKVSVWDFRTTIDNIVGNVITLHDAVASPTSYMQPPFAAWSGATVHAQTEFTEPAGLPARLEDHPLAYLTTSPLDLD